MCLCVCVSYNEIRLALGLMKPVVIYQHYVRLHPPALFIKLQTLTPQRCSADGRGVMAFLLPVFLSFFPFNTFFFLALSSPHGLSSQMWCVASNTFALSVSLISLHYCSSLHLKQSLTAARTTFLSFSCLSHPSLFPIGLLKICCCCFFTSFPS